MTAKLLTILVILALVLVYTLQNTEQVEIAFYPWKAQVSKALLTLGMLLVGIVIGFILGKVDRKMFSRREETKGGEEKWQL